MCATTGSTKSAPVNAMLVDRYRTERIKRSSSEAEVGNSSSEKSGYGCSRTINCTSNRDFEKRGIPRFSS